jgi:hypothetical protein
VIQGVEPLAAGRVSVPLAADIPDVGPVVVRTDRSLLAFQPLVGIEPRPGIQHDHLVGVGELVRDQPAGWPRTDDTDVRILDRLPAHRFPPGGPCW